jgi:Holliday junction resolvasome RuvABC endonuclease subunit
MNYIAIDFSINSTAICVQNHQKLKWFNFVSNLDLNKKAFKCHKELVELGINIIGYDRNKPKDLEYTDEQAFKLNNSNYLSYTIINTLAPYINEDTQWAIEGYSYGSKGNSFIDLITYNTMLKAKIMRVSKNDIQVYAPKTVKKSFTGNGNANKPMMVEAFKSREDLVDDAFKKYIDSHSFGDNIPKPIDDLVDAFAILEFLKETI